MSKKFKLADSIVFENDHYFIINKPISYSVLDDRSDSDLPSLLELAKEYNSKAQVCHRLDKETSGILVFSKTTDAYRNIALQFEHREVAKIYHAIVHGRHKFEERVVELNLSHSSGITKVDKAGKFSSTIIETISVLHQFTLVECMPLTGRTHQIRAHLSYLEAPIVGDEKYGGQAFYLSSIKKKFSIGKYDEEKPLLARTALHAFKIKFMDLDQKDIIAEAPYPKDFQASLKQLLKTK
ncbi:MAG: RluA family pseudouridine synthase [Cytophagales bacterium]